MDYFSFHSQNLSKCLANYSKVPVNACHVLCVRHYTANCDFTVYVWLLCADSLEQGMVHIKSLINICWIN
jgi:hypothetical protein